MPFRGAIACLDVAYPDHGARAACVVAASWESESPASTYVREIDVVQPYAPGEFYRRELPCLLAVLDLLPALPEVVVIDGYVWLSDSRPGLGAHLHAALGGKIPVVGVAKSAFAGVESCSRVVQVFRGESKRALFVTAAGMEPAVAGECVRCMAGAHRIPELLRVTDRLSRALS